MVNIIIDGKNYSANENQTILQVCKKNNIYIPTLCYLENINEIGACRVCIVEVEGENKLIPSCKTFVTDGMVIKTNSQRVIDARKINLALILSRHDNKCNTCARGGNCELQSLAYKYGLTEIYQPKVTMASTNKDFPLIREASKCIGCLRCVSVCDKISSMGIWDLVGTGKNAKVDTTSGKKIENDKCTLCGQCITHCPVGALHERDDIDKVERIINSNEKITVVQVAPAVRSAFGESLYGKAVSEGKMVSALKKLGFNYVFDTNFSADLTIMEEATELIDRIVNKGTMPMFTSCCPGWIRFIKSEYPQLIGHLSSAKSPQQMFGAIAKSYFASKLGVSADKIYCVSIMPCVAKKAEAKMDVMYGEYGADVDAVLTTREFEKWVRRCNIDATTLKEEKFDSPLGVGTGAGVIFGTTGGVMEAALRTAYNFLTGQNPNADFIKDYRIEQGLGTFKATIGDKTYSFAVVSGLNLARQLMEEVKENKSKYDFIEVMACPSGCAGGGGQPIKEGQELGVKRAEILYSLDKNNALRFSHENPEIVALYKDFLEKPNSHLAHKLLHVDHTK